MAGSEKQPIISGAVWLLHLTTLVTSYTVEDILIRCIPCRPRTKVGHPTDCHKYFHCTAAKSWRQLSCPASTYYNEATKLCIDPRTTNGSVCLYEQGINVNQYRDVEYLPVCRNAIPPTTASPSTTVTGGVPVKPTDRQSGDGEDKTTVILASLLATTVVVLVLVILAVFLYRRHLRRKRPYLHQVMVEAECYDWCAIISTVLRDEALFNRTINVSATLANTDSENLNRLCALLTTLKTWIDSDCLGYKPFVTSVSDYIDSLIQLNNRTKPRSRHGSSIHSSSQPVGGAEVVADSNESTTPIDSDPPELSEASNSGQSDSCIIS